MTSVISGPRKRALLRSTSNKNLKESYIISKINQNIVKTLEFPVRNCTTAIFNPILRRNNVVVTAQLLLLLSLLLFLHGINDFTSISSTFPKKTSLSLTTKNIYFNTEDKTRHVHTQDVNIE